MKKFTLFDPKHTRFSFIFFTLIFSSLFLFQGMAQSAQGDSAFREDEIKPGELIVKLKSEYVFRQFPNEIVGINDVGKRELNMTDMVSSVSFNSVEKTFKRLSKKSTQLTDYYLVSFDSRIDIGQLKGELEQLEEVENVSYVPLVKVDCNPNDPYYNGGPESWHLDAIDANNIWCNITQGCSNTVIAIVDDAVLTTHEDLINKISGEFDVADNDGNADPPYMSNSTFTHGTHVAGIAGAETNNGVGIASLGYNSSLYAIKCTKDNSPNPAYLDAPYVGVEHAIDQGVDVINMSWGGGGFVPAYQDLFSEAYTLGIICVAAAGNNNFPASSYPGAYNHVISVAATNSDNERACFSNYGTYVDVAAPGEDIFSTLAGSNSSYGYLSGTSMASPLVAAQAALMKCEDPSLNTDEIESCLTSNTFPLDPNPDCSPSTIDEELPDFVEAFSCDPDSISDCLPPVDCELVWNGDFEQIFGTATSSTDFSQVCYWDRTNSTPYYCAHPTDGNSIGLWLAQGDIERVTSENPISFTVGQEYYVSFDYHVTKLNYSSTTSLPPQSLQVALTTTNTAGVLPPTATIIAQINNPPIDNLSQNNHQCHEAGAVFHSFEGCFTYNGPGSEYLNLTGVPSSNVTISFIDNVSIRPKIEFEVSALDSCVQCGDCTWLEVTGSGFSQVVWSPEELIETDPTANSVKVCPKETTTYTVTVYDDVSGCTDSKDITIEVKEPEWELECHLNAGFFCIVDEMGNSPNIEWVSPFAGSTSNCQSIAGLSYGDPLTFIITTSGPDGECTFEYTTEYTCEECKCEIKDVEVQWPECWSEDFCVTMSFWFSGTDNNPLNVMIDNVNSTPGFNLVSVTNLSNPPGAIVIQGYNQFELCFTYNGECKEDPILYIEGIMCEDGGCEDPCIIEERHQAPCCEDMECKCEFNEVSTKWPECWSEDFCVITEFWYDGTENLPLEVVIDNLSSSPGFNLVSVTSLTNPPGSLVVQGYNQFEICFTYTGECKGEPTLSFDAFVCSDDNGEPVECLIEQRHQTKCCDDMECRCEFKDVRVDWPECWTEDFCVIMSFDYDGTENQSLEVIIDLVNSTPGFGLVSVSSLTNPPGDIVVLGYNEFELCFTYTGECEGEPALYFDAYVCKDSEGECRIQEKHQTKCCDDMECRCEFRDVRVDWPECWSEEFCLIMSFEYDGTENQPLEVIIDLVNSTPGFGLVSVSSLTNPPGDIVVPGYNEFELCFKYTGDCEGEPELHFDAYVCRGSEGECRIQEKHRTKCCDDMECRCEFNEVKVNWPECWKEEFCVTMSFHYDGTENQPLEVIIDNINSTPGFGLVSVSSLTNPPGDIVVLGYNEFELCFKYTGDCEGEPELHFDAYVCRGSEGECRIQERHKAKCCDVEECRCEFRDVKVEWPECWSKEFCITLGFTYDGTENQPLEVIIDNINSTPGFTLVSVTNLSNPPGDIVILGDNKFELCFEYTGDCEGEPTLQFDAYVCRGSEGECRIQERHSTRCCEKGRKNVKSIKDGTSLSHELNVFPNPALEKFTVSFTPADRDRNLLITDINDKVIFDLNVSKGKEEVVISTENISSGVYFVQLAGLEETIKRVVVLK